MRCLALLVLAACSGQSTAPAPSPPPTGVAAADAAVPADAPVRRIDRAIIAKHWSDASCFTIRDTDGTIHTNDPQRCATPRRPYSTFKIPNALIGVELGILANADAAMTWDRRAIPDERGFADVWRRPHTLRTGIAVSAVPYFRTLALQIGEERMRAHLDKLAYGNRDLGGGLDRFWLTRGALRISASEQLTFAEGLARGTLPFSAHAQATVREVSELARTPDGTRRLHGKTGSGPIEDTKGGWIVWQVGWVATGADVFPYAAWIEVKTPASELGRGPTLDEARAARELRLRTTLDDLGLFPRM